MPFIRVPKARRTSNCDDLHAVVAISFLSKYSHWYIVVSVSLHFVRRTTHNRRNMSQAELFWRGLVVECIETLAD